MQKGQGSGPTTHCICIQHGTQTTSYHGSLFASPHLEIQNGSSTQRPRLSAWERVGRWEAPGALHGAGQVHLQGCRCLVSTCVPNSENSASVLSCKPYRRHRGSLLFTKSLPWVTQLANSRIRTQVYTVPMCVVPFTP